MKRIKSFTLVSVVLLFSGGSMFTSCKEQPEKTYEPTWESIESHPLPQCYEDAKFGIFIHWGGYSVSAYRTEWDET